MTGQPTPPGKRRGSAPGGSDGSGFLLALFAVLFWGLAGVAGAAAGFVCLRVAPAKLPRTLVLAIAVAVGMLAIVGCERLAATPW